MESKIEMHDEQGLQSKIYVVRGVQVMLDIDLAAIYGYTVKAFNQQVKNNMEKFDDDFMFQLTAGELDNLRSKFLTAIVSPMSRALQYAFTEQGIYMLMTVLKGERAIKQSKALVRLFKQMKDYVIENQQIVSQRDFLRLSLQTAENAENIADFRKRLLEIDDKVEKVVSNLGDMVRKSELSPIMLNLGKPEIPAGWLILNGQRVESDLAYQQIYALANRSIFIVDNYISLKTLVLFKHARQDVAVTIFSDNAHNGLHKVEFEDFCKEYSGLRINVRVAVGIFHDRYIVLGDGTVDERIYHCGASSKDGGRKVTTITLTEDTAVYAGLIEQLLKNKSLVLK